MTATITHLITKELITSSPPCHGCGFHDSRIKDSFAWGWHIAAASMFALGSSGSWPVPLVWFKRSLIWTSDLIQSGCFAQQQEVQQNQYRNQLIVWVATFDLWKILSVECQKNKSTTEFSSPTRVEQKRTGGGGATWWNWFLNTVHSLLVPDPARIGRFDSSLTSLASSSEENEQTSVIRWATLCWASYSILTERVLPTSSRLMLVLLADRSSPIFEL